MWYIKRFFRSDEEGATAIEYGLIAAFVAVAIAGALQIIEGDLRTVFEAVQDNLNEAADEVGGGGGESG